MSTAWPFARGSWYSFAEFREFETALLAARRADKKLDLDLACGREAWMKVRNEEVYPAEYFRRHMSLPLSAEFLIGLEGALADIEVRADALTRRLQITTAGPLWPDGPRNWGQDHVLHMTQLKREGQSSGWGPYRKQSDGSITNRAEAITTAERNPAYFAGIRQALLGKQLNQHSDCVLIVRAGGYDRDLSPEAFSEIANAALSEVPLQSFSAIHVLAASEGYIVSKPA